MRQSACTMHDANRSALLFTAKLPIWTKKDESNALDDSTRRSCNLSARASESTRAAVHRKLDHGAMQVDRWPISALPGERLGARRPAYAAVGRPGLRAGKNMGLRRQWSLGRSWLPRRVRVWTGGRPSGRSMVVRCSSQNGTRRTCPVGGFIKSATVEQQFSGSPCIQDSTWGFDNRSLWVNRGCRADFRVWLSR
jgi:hypothetical protein